jgi:hypothetical protein
MVGALELFASFQLKSNYEDVSAQRAYGIAHVSVVVVNGVPRAANCSSCLTEEQPPAAYSM